MVINLAGRSVNCRYTARNRQAILDSRIVPTQLIGEIIGHAARPPRVWLQASTATIYAHRLDAANDEATGRIGGDDPGAPSTWKFSIEVATRWEQTLTEAVTPHTRKVALRSTMTMRRIRRDLRHAGGAGQARAWRHTGTDVVISWITSTISSGRALVDRTEIGVVNVAAPHPLPNTEFMRICATPVAFAWDYRPR